MNSSYVEAISIYSLEHTSYASLDVELVTAFDIEASFFQVPFADELQIMFCFEVGKRKLDYSVLSYGLEKLAGIIFD